MSEVMNGAKKTVKSKTMILNSLLCVVAVVNLTQGSGLLPPVAMAYLFLASNICNLILRYFFTDQGLKL